MFLQYFLGDMKENLLEELVGRIVIKTKKIVNFSLLDRQIEITKNAKQYIRKERLKINKKKII